MSSFYTLMKKECAEDILSFRSLLLFLFASVLMSIFAFLLISNKELSLLDNAHAIYMMIGIVLVLSSLIIIIQGSDSIAGERDRETLEVLLLSPIGSKGLILAKLGKIMISWLFLYVLAIPYLWAVGSTGQNLWPAIYILFITGTLLTLILSGISLIISAEMSTLKGALFISMVIFLLLVSPTVLGSSLRQTMVGRVFDFINPFMDALNSIDSVIIDSEKLNVQSYRLGIMVLYTIVIQGFLFGGLRRIKL